jgi:AraC-like DNA-binding protein/mannose-6-phosphate isomerase-like protein (cupin superfamily)
VSRNFPAMNSTIAASLAERKPIDCWFARDVASHWPDTAAAKLPLVVRVDDVPPSLLDAPHRHRDFFALYVVRSGRGVHVIDDVSYGVCRGDVYVMGLGATHCYTQCHRLISDALYFSPAIFSQNMLEVLSETPGFLTLFVEAPFTRSPQRGGRWLHLAPHAYDDVSEKIAELKAEWASGSPAGTMLAHMLFVRLLVHLARSYEDGNSRLDGPHSPALAETTVAAAVRFIDEHFSEPLRIEQVAASVFLSADRFTEVFTKVMGRTPRDYLRHVRLECAKRLLLSTGESISAIGCQAGFGEASYFTRAFGAATGMTPSRYRAAHRRAD